MLRTFGRIMPIVMPLSGIMAMLLVVVSRLDARIVFVLRVAAVLCIIATVVTTLTVNVPINNRTAAWQITNDVAEWYRMRAQWHVFQGVRGGLFALAFVLLAIALLLKRPN